MDDVQLRANARDQCASGRIRPLSVLSGMFVRMSSDEAVGRVPHKSAH